MTFRGPWDGWFILNHVFAVLHHFLFFLGGGLSWWVMQGVEGGSDDGQCCCFIRADGGLGGAESVVRACLRAHGHAHTKGPQSRC